MAETAVVDAGFLAALLRRRDTHHDWAAAQAARFPPPWLTCEAVLSEACFLLSPAGSAALIALLERGALRVGFALAGDLAPVLALLRKYADVPMSLADACLVRMTEIVPDPVVLTADADFRVYRRHSRQVVPCVFPA